MTTSAEKPIPPAPNWDLDSIFPGGSLSPQYTEFRQKTRSRLEGLNFALSQLPAALNNVSAPEWIALILDLQQIAEELRLIRGFAGCLMAQNVDDSAAFGIAGESDTLIAEWEKIKTGLEARSIRQSDDAWKDLLAARELSEIAFFLTELRDNARSKMSVELESLALDLAVNGYHIWNRVYDKTAGNQQVDFEMDGQTRKMSLGQLASIMDNPNRDIRRRAFETINKSWEEHIDMAVTSLNAQAGFRLAWYDHRGWSSPLYEPLLLNRLSQKSLDAMWHVVAESTSKLKPYVDAKKRLLGIDKFSWYDEFALCGKSQQTQSFDSAAEFIVTQLNRFSPELGEFCKMAVDKRWVEAEDRPGKRAGAFCSFMGIHRQSRIFMTYAGTLDNVSTLAHELGHGYHTYVLRKKPFFATTYPMGLAETASIFNELVTNDSALSVSTDSDEKLKLMDQALQNAYVFFTDIRSRFLFDTAFYAARRKGVVGKEQLDELMLEAQKTAFGGLLDNSGYHKRFWCTKQHFFMTTVPFYNFPYTFGFLFANGVYDRALKEGSSFASRYHDLLADTGSMTAEQVAQKHLGADLTHEQFWRDAVNRSLSQLDNFLDVAKHM